MLPHVTSDKSIFWWPNLELISPPLLCIGHHYWNPCPAWDDSGSFSPPTDHNIGQDHHTHTSNGATRYSPLSIFLPMFACCIQQLAWPMDILSLVWSCCNVECCLLLLFWLFSFLSNFCLSGQGQQVVTQIIRGTPVSKAVSSNTPTQVLGSPPRPSTPGHPQTPQTPSSARPQQGQVKLTLAQLTQLTQGAQVCTYLCAFCTCFTSFLSLAGIPWISTDKLI